MEPEDAGKVQVICGLILQASSPSPHTPGSGIETPLFASLHVLSSLLRGSIWVEKPLRHFPFAQRRLERPQALTSSRMSGSVNRACARAARMRQPPCSPVATSTDYQLSGHNVAYSGLHGFHCANARYAFAMLSGLTIVRHSSTLFSLVVCTFIATTLSLDVST